MPPALPIVRSTGELRAQVRAWRAAGERVGFVPTMGALHEGHLSLVRLAKTRADRCVASVFVNPTQFAPSEDFAAYPRDEARDAALLADAGCDLLWAPTVREMYPDGFATAVSVSGVSAPLEGEKRPTHFQGVATVVAKLLNQVQPDLAAISTCRWRSSGRRPPGTPMASPCPRATPTSTPPSARPPASST
jgi:pantoate--beta-alanine ligase